jgi:hypothetical protein
MFLPVIRSDLMTHSRYRPGADSAVSCPIIVLMGAADPLTDSPDVQAWQRHTSSTLLATPATGITVHEEHLALHVDLMVRGGPLAREAEMAQLTPVP